MADAMTEGDRPGSLSLRFFGPTSSASSSRLVEEKAAVAEERGGGGKGWGWGGLVVRWWWEEEWGRGAPLEGEDRWEGRGGWGSVRVRRSTWWWRPGEEDEERAE